MFINYRLTLEPMWSLYFFFFRLIRKVGHKLKEIGALTNPLRAEKNRGVIEGAHTLSRVEEYLEECFVALQHFTGMNISTKKHTLNRKQFYTPFHTYLDHQKLMSWKLKSEFNEREFI